MDEEIVVWFTERGYVGTKEFRNTQLALLSYLEHGKAGLYRALCAETGDSYSAFSRSVGRGTKKIWEKEDMFSKVDEKPTPITILEELACSFREKRR